MLDNVFMLHWHDVLHFSIISTLKALKASLTEHQHKLHQVLEDGRHFLSYVSCPSLENQLASLGEHWMSNSTNINMELQHLDSVLKHWTRSGHLLCVQLFMFFQNHCSDGRSMFVADINMSLMNWAAGWRTLGNGWSFGTRKPPVHRTLLKTSCQLFWFVKFI